MARYQINLTKTEIKKIKLGETQRAAIKFLNTKPGLLPSGNQTPKAVLELIEIGLVKEGVRIVGLEGESKSAFYLTPPGEIWWKAAQALAEKHRGRKGVFSAQECKDYLRSIWNVPPYTSLEAIAAACEKEFGERVNLNMVRGEGYNRLRLPPLRRKIIEPVEIEHPIAARATIRGVVIKAGTILKSTDCYASTTGKWLPCPCPGVALPEGLSVIWVRPYDVQRPLSETP